MSNWIGKGGGGGTWKVRAPTQVHKPKLVCLSAQGAPGTVEVLSDWHVRGVYKFSITTSLGWHMPWWHQGDNHGNSQWTALKANTQWTRAEIGFRLPQHSPTWACGCSVLDAGQLNNSPRVRMQWICILGLDKQEKKGKQKGASWSLQERHVEQCLVKK